MSPAEPSNAIPTRSPSDITRRILRGLFALPLILSLAALLIAPSGPTVLLMFWMVVLFTPGLFWPQFFAPLYGKGLMAVSVVGFILPSQMRDPFETAGRSGLENTITIGTYYAAVTLLLLAGIALLVSPLMAPLLREIRLSRRPSRKIGR
jgi:hypothetical protein